MQIKKAFKLKTFTNEMNRCTIYVRVFDNNFVHIRKVFFANLEMKTKVTRIILRTLKNKLVMEEVVALRESTLLQISKMIWK